MMHDPTPKNAKSNKSRTQSNAEDISKRTVSKTHSHFLIPSDKLDKITKRVIAPYAQIERKGAKEEEKPDIYLDINRFNVFLEDTVDLDKLFYETAMVLKTVTDSSGVFVYIVDKAKNEIILMQPDVQNPERHEVNIQIEEGKTAAAHVAFTKNYLVLDDVQRDRRFAEGLRWVDAKVALCMPVVKPDGDCYAVLELYRTCDKKYDETILYTVVSVVCWAGAAVHQAQARIALQKTSHLNNELRALLQKYFCDLASIDTMLTDMLNLLPIKLGASSLQPIYVPMLGTGLLPSVERAERVLGLNPHTLVGGSDMSLEFLLGHGVFLHRQQMAVVKTFIGAMRSSFFIIDKENINNQLLADMWDDGWTSEKTAMPKKKNKVNLTQEQTPAGLVARTGQSLNVIDSYKDPRFSNEIDPITGTVVRSCLVSPILDKTGVIGVVQLTNKRNARPFNEEDEQIFSVFVNYCSLIVYFYNMERKKIYHYNLNRVFSELLCLHLKPCSHIFDEMMESNRVIVPPVNFKNHNFHISDVSKDDMAGLICHMFSETFGELSFDRLVLTDFVLTVLLCYRDNAYHNAEHAFTFTHTLYLILVDNPDHFDPIETIGLMLAGLCHDVDHPGYNNNFLALCKHPLSKMYRSSMLEYHHFFLAKKIIEDKMILGKLPKIDQERIMEEIEYNILCTDLAVYFQIRAQLTPVLADSLFDWNNTAHRNMIKGIIMTTSDLSGTCKQFGVAKSIALSVYEEFYEQGDRERELGYTPLSMMDRRRKINQPAEQIQFLSVVVLPCLLLLNTIFPNTGVLIDNCRKTQESWHEEIEIRGQKLWRQEDSVPSSRRIINSKNEENKSGMT